MDETEAKGMDDRTRESRLETARQVQSSYGDDAPLYVKTRVETAAAAGDHANAEAWRQVLDLLGGDPEAKMEPVSTVPRLEP
jgi:hypothetical protein